MRETKSDGSAAWARPLHDSRLPPTTHLTWASGLMVEAGGARIDAQQATTLSVWPMEEGHGTPLYWSRNGPMMWAYFGAHTATAISSDALSDRWNARLFDEPTLLRQLSGVFSLVVIDVERRRVFAAADRLGVQSVHYCRDGSGTIRLSTHLMWLLRATGHRGDVNAAPFLTHFGFGYPVAPDEHIYEGVRKLPPAGYLVVSEGELSVGSYWSDDRPQGSTESTIAKITKALAHATSSTGPGVEACVGLTGGKDSLCLVSVIPQSARPPTATFGAPRCADRVQAELIASALSWPHSKRTLCGAREFRKWAIEVACHSAGLATASYVDMAAFVAECVPRGHALVMGEGGECVRDFFQPPGHIADEYLRSHYMTAPEHLRRTLSADFAGELASYPERLVERTRQCSKRSPDDFMLWFYRTQRMPGNFSLRHTVLSALRPKLSPFLDAHFIDATYALDRSWYHGSALHRAIIEQANPQLLRYFDRPTVSTVETQDWARRFATTIGPVVYQLLDESLPFCRDVFQIDEVRALCRETIARPSRAMYHIFRVLSFALGRLALRSIGRSSESTFLGEVRALLDHPQLVFAPAHRDSVS